MPNMDGTGPRGMGCEYGEAKGFGRGTGRGAGRGRGFGPGDGSGRHPRCPKNQQTGVKKLDETEQIDHNE